MGYSLPASMGAKLGNPDKEVICIIGDGGIQVNLQELQTVSSNAIDIKIFLLNNNGYASIQEFQDKELEGRYLASDLKHGYSHPDFKKLCSAFNIPYSIINNKKDFYKINEVLKTK
jgi:acetolactate synthase-1/2/3 large subunit